VEQHSFERSSGCKWSRRKVMNEEKQMGKRRAKANVALLFVYFVSGMCDVRMSDDLMLLIHTKVLSPYY
jgi:hypothetical protein